MVAWGLRALVKEMPRALLRRFCFFVRCFFLRLTSY